jgi:arsenite-transporting ATPase
MRAVIYTGKGGVGKTSLAAATALAAAERGHRALVLSTDAAHSLGDALGQALGPAAARLAPNLWALEVDVLTELRRNWAAVHQYLTALLVSQGVGEITAQEVVILPGMELIAALLLLDEATQTSRYDAVILDTAPTADTLRLLSFPDAVEWYFTHLFRLHRGVTRVVRTTVGRAMRTPLPSEDFFDALESLHERFRRIRTLLTDPGQTSVRLVVNPERMVIAETQRAYTYLSLFGLSVDLLVVNRVFPAEAARGYFAPLDAEQRRNLATLEELFGDLPRREVPRYPREVIGRDALRRLAKDVFGRDDPIRAGPSRPAPVRFLAQDGHPRIELRLPYVSAEDVEVARRGDLLYVRVGAQRRSIALPYAYAEATVERAYFNGETFTVDFRTTAHAAKPKP